MKLSSYSVGISDLIADKKQMIQFLIKLMKKN